MNFKRISKVKICILTHEIDVSFVGKIEIWK
jgi:hypothetical protein